MFFSTKEIKTVFRLQFRLLSKIWIDICNNLKLISAYQQKKIIFTIASLLLSLSFSCKKNNDLLKISDYKEFNRIAAHLTCEKIIGCYNYIYRTFPKNLLKSTRVEDCEEHVLQNLDEKLKNHNEKIQYYARTCYTEILNTPCKNLTIAVLTNPTCNALKKEIGLQAKQ